MPVTLATDPYGTPGAITLSLSPAEGFHGVGVDVGSPTVRDVVDDRPGDDGTIDATAHHGARTVTITATVTDTATDTTATVLARLATWCHPARRFWVWLEVDGVIRQIYCRPDKVAAPLAARLRSVQLQLVAPTGLLEATSLSSVWLPPVGSAAAGRTYPLTPPRSYPAAGPSGPMTVVSAGSAPAPWVAKIYGPCTDPVLHSGDDQVSTTGLTVAAGDYLEVDSQERTVRLNGEAGASRYGFLDFPNVTWWRIQPGLNTLRLTAATASAPAGCRLEWRDRHYL